MLALLSTGPCQNLLLMVLLRLLRSAITSIPTTLLLGSNFSVNRNKSFLLQTCEYSFFLCYFSSNRDLHEPVSCDQLSVRKADRQSRLAGQSRDDPVRVRIRELGHQRRVRLPQGGLPLHRALGHPRLQESGADFATLCLALPGRCQTRFCYPSLFSVSFI